MRRVPGKKKGKEVPGKKKGKEVDDDLRQAETPAGKKKKKEARVDSQ